MNKPVTKKNAFTLIELLIVVSTLFILASVILPIIRAMNTKAERNACAENMHQLSIIIDQYIQDNEGSWPMGKRQESTGTDIRWYDRLIESNPDAKQHLLCPATKGSGASSDIKPVSYAMHFGLPDDTIHRGMMNEEILDASGGYAQSNHAPWQIKRESIRNPADSILLFEYNLKPSRDMNSMDAISFHLTGLRQLALEAGPGGLLFEPDGVLGGGRFAETYADVWVHDLFSMNFLFVDGSVRYLAMPDTVNPGTLWYEPNVHEAENGFWDCQGTGTSPSSQNN